LGRRVTLGSEVVAAISEALAHDGPALVDIVTDAALV
jgi:thiamine pyrophosphate-dependent acetolactate synthase large subunit-like protein